MNLGDKHFADQLLLVFSQGLSSDDFGLLSLELNVRVIMSVNVMLLNLELLRMMSGRIFDVLIFSLVGVNFS